MSTVKIKDIEIHYDNVKNKNIDDIKSVIDKNYNLFLSILGEKKVISLVSENEEGAVYISDFDKTFSEVVSQLFNDKNVNSLLEDPDALPAFYLETLVRKNANNSMSLLQPDPDISDEMLYSYIAYIYFAKKGTFDDFVSYLKERKETDKILSWVQTEARFDTYNLLLEQTINSLKISGFDFLENISGIVHIMLEQSTNNLLQQKEEIELPKMTTQELYNLFDDFLIYINAPKDWKNAYDELKSSNRISFEQANGIDISMCYSDENDILKIQIFTDGTIKCFCTFVHEFTHYISMQDKGYIPIEQHSISEFPSIFFEKKAAQFLVDKGYEQNIVDKVVRDRNRNNIEGYMGISSLFNDLYVFTKRGSISRDKKVAFYENSSRLIQETKENIAKVIAAEGISVDPSFLEPPKIDIPKAIDKDCDFLIDSLIKNDSFLIDGYQYLLGTYLAEEVLKSSNDDVSIIPRMINVTNNLCNMNLKDVLREFNIQGIANDSKNNVVIKSKKANQNRN